MTLLSLASKQNWPQVLSVLHLKPQSVILLHSGNLHESKHPAQLLKRFFDQSELIPRGGTRLERISHDDFEAVESSIEGIITKNRLGLADVRLNFTGGNKLMATAAFRWAARRGVSSFYLEKENRLFCFDSRDGALRTRSETLDGHSADAIDPAEMLRCQLDASEIERPGQLITLNARGRTLGDAELFKRIANGNDMTPFLDIKGEADRQSKSGDPLEFTTATVLLTLGIKQVRRSLRLKVRQGPSVGTRRPHAEVDLVFIWDGRLWLVDCKDETPAEDLAETLHSLLGPLRPNAEQLFNRIRDKLKISHTKVLKEDLLAVREAGGLQGKAVCIRAETLPDEVVQYANLNAIEIILKQGLVDGLKRLLFPRSAPDANDLAGLDAQFRKT